jgi:hypothetical protein
MIKVPYTPAPVESPVVTDDAITVWIDRLRAGESAAVRGPSIPVDCAEVSTRAHSGVRHVRVCSARVGSEYRPRAARRVCPGPRQCYWRIVVIRSDRGRMMVVAVGAGRTPSGGGSSR